jgi:hypothetical protein
MPSDALITAEATERLARLRAGMVDEISRQEKMLSALRARLSGVDAVISVVECVPPAGRGDA